MGEEYSKSSLITYLRNCFVKSFTDILPICNDFKRSSQNGRRFHFHLRFEGDMGDYGITVLSFFSSGISVILILMCGIAVSSSPAVCGFSSFG